MIKLRKTSQRTPTSMVIEPPYQLNGTRPDPYAPRWRHLVCVFVFPASSPLPPSLCVCAGRRFCTRTYLTFTRMACGESTRAYGNRMDNMWALRAAFAMARGFRDAQDAFCARVEAGLWDEVAAQSYPEDYRWEALVDVLRGKAKVSVYIISIAFVLYAAG